MNKQTIAGAEGRIIKRISKFDFIEFYTGFDEISVAVSMQRYTKEEAIDIAKHEMCPRDSQQEEPIMVREAWVTHRAGVNEDNEPCVGWWLDDKPYKRSCPVWVFRLGKRRFDFMDGYEEAVHV